MHRIAIVDPNEASRESLRTMLLGVDFVWLEAECARYEYFFDVIQQCSPDLVIVALDGDKAKALNMVGQLGAEYPRLPILTVKDGAYELKLELHGDKDLADQVESLTGGGLELLARLVGVGLERQLRVHVGRRGEKDTRCIRGPIAPRNFLPWGCSSAGGRHRALACALTRNVTNLGLLSGIDNVLPDVDKIQTGMARRATNGPDDPWINHQPPL